MRRLHKSKRISWAADVNLCQVKLFLSEECPSQVGLIGQDHLQAKASWLVHSTGTGSEDILPPGFEGSPAGNQLEISLSDFPLIKWSCPHRIVLDSTWLVAAGDESKEVDILNDREMRVLEAIYPRPSAIPPNPSVSADTENSNQNDWQTPLIPITPIEDEDAAADTPLDSMAAFNIPSSSQHSLLTPSSQASLPTSMKITAAGLDTDAVAAAFGAVMKSNEQGNLIDHDLLVKILGNQNMVEKLVRDLGPSANRQNISKPEMVTQSATTSSGSYYPPSNVVGVGHHLNPPLPPPGAVANSSIGAPPKDFNYYKNLIHQHGGERQEALPQFGKWHSSQAGANQESMSNPKPRDSKQRIMKPCIYFNSARGCRHGSNCSYQHDEAYQRRGSNMPEGQSAKRTKMDREITGT